MSPKIVMVSRVAGATALLGIAVVPVALVAWMGRDGALFTLRSEGRFSTVGRNAVAAFAADTPQPTFVLDDIVIVGDLGRGLEQIPAAPAAAVTPRPTRVPQPSVAAADQ